MFGGLAVKRIRDVENVGFDLASVVVFERHHARCGGVAQSLATNVDLMVRDHRRLVGGLFFCFAGRGSGLWRLVRRSGCRWSTCRWSTGGPLLRSDKEGRERYESEEQGQSTTKHHARLHVGLDVIIEN